MNTTSSSYGRLTAVLIAVWFILAFSASALNLFTPNSDLPPIALGLAAVIPVLIFLAWYAASAEFRQFALNLDARILTFVQAWRIAGYTFLALASAGLLPLFFALPAGWGDFAIGLTAPLVALKLTDGNRRSSFIFWQILGMFDLVLAVSLGATARLISPHGIATAMMAVLPMSMIPAFAVPLFFILHIICIAQARQWVTTAAPVASQAVTR